MLKFLFLFQKFSFKESTIYLDLVRECALAGHEVYVLAGTSEEVDDTVIHDVDGCHVAYVTLPDQFGCGKIKKGLIQLLIEPRFLHVIYQHFWKKEIDLIVCPTPPITMAGVIAKAKKHYNCKAYLMLKDIFPQNAVDLGMFSSSGLIYRYYRRMEKQLYEYSDRIGCMSEANIEYLKAHNPEIDNKKLEYFPNTAAVKEPAEDGADNSGPSGAADDGRLRIVFGGNMGRPQDVEGLLASIHECGKRADLADVFFYFYGDGTESRKIEEYIEREKPANLIYRHQLPRDEYEKSLKNSDAGIISLADSFTIPNFPSRLLSYMQISKPVFAVTDASTDIPECIMEEAHCGYAVRAGSPEAFLDGIYWLKSHKKDLPGLGMNGRRYFERYFNVGVSADILERAYRG